MNQSFYTGALGAIAQQAGMNVVSNNIANVNTVGYKAQEGTFSDLMYAQVRSAEGGNGAKTGSGTVMNGVKTDLGAMAYNTTNGRYDYAIEGEGFFMLKDPVTEEITYSRDGNFHLSESGDQFYLVNNSGKRVLNMDQEEISWDVKEAVYPGEDTEDEEEDGEEIGEDEHDPRAVGVYTFAVRDGIEGVGDNEFAVTAKNGDPILLENAGVVKGALEESGTDFAREMTRMIEAQRAYSYALKMIQTSDEIEAKINELR